MNKKLSIGVIGMGRFGMLVASILSKHAEVLVHSADTKALPERANKVGARPSTLRQVANCDIVILTVPISKTEEMIKVVAPMMKTGSLLLDTCSVKVYPCQWLEKYVPTKIEVMGTHPMFGPVSSGFDLEKQKWQLKGLQIVLCPIRIKAEHLELIKKFLKSLKLEVILTSPENHDEQNATTLSLVHFLGRSLKEADIKEQKICTPGFESLLKIYEHTTSDDWQLFFDMNNYNPYAIGVRKKFMNACRMVENKINKDYEQTFKQN